MPALNAEWEVSVQDVNELRRARQPLLLLDVREADENQLCRIEGARLVPLSELPNRLEEVRELAGDKPIVVHCHRGRRSLAAASILRQAGLASAMSMAGGIDAWSCEIDPTVPRY